MARIRGQGGRQQDVHPCDQNPLRSVCTSRFAPEKKLQLARKTQTTGRRSSPYVRQVFTHPHPHHSPNTSHSYALQPFCAIGTCPTSPYSVASLLFNPLFAQRPALGNVCYIARISLHRDGCTSHQSSRRCTLAQSRARDPQQKTHGSLVQQSCAPCTLDK